MRRILPMLLWLMSLSAFAQRSTGSLLGTVETDSTFLPFANLILQQTKYHTTADSLGRFEFKDLPAGRYTLIASYVGCESQSREVMIRAGGSTEINLKLAELSASLNETIVTGILNEKKRTDNVGTINVYPADYFKKNAANNLFDALSMLNGIYADVDQGASYVTDININGLEGNYTMYLIDGVPAMNGLAGIYALTAFPIDMVDRIEVEAGPSSLLYGSDAIAGVINIITKDPEKAHALVLNATLNSLLDANFSLTGSFRTGKATSLIATSVEGWDYKRDINHDGFMDYPLVNRCNFFNKWSIDRRDKKKTFVYARYLFEDRFVGQIATPGRVINSDQWYTEWIRTNQWQAGMQYEMPVKERLLLAIDYSEHYQKAYFDTNYFHGNQKTGFVQLSWNKGIKRHLLDAGISYRLKYYSDNTGLSDAALTGLSNLTHIAGIYLQDQVRLSPKNTLLFGARFDYNTRTGPIGTPAISYKWSAESQKDIFRLSISTAYRVPNLLNEGFGAINGSRQVEVDGPLKTEYAVGLITSYNHLQRFSKGAINFQIGAFGTWLTNFINPDYESDPNKIIYRNSNGGGTVGANFKADLVFDFPLKAGLALTYAVVREINKGDSGTVTIEIPTHSPPLTANWYIGYTFVKAGVTIDYTASLISPMLLATVDGDFRPDHSPWFSIENIQITKKFRKGVELFAGVKNFLNFMEKNPILNSFDPFNKTVNNPVLNPNGYYFDTTYGYMPLEGVKAFVGFRYTFH